jgi:YopX protein.
MRKIKFMAYIKSLGWLVAVERICFDCNTVEVDLTNGQGDTCEYDFDEVILIQYTGLNDCNDSEIFEGHLLDFKDKKHAHRIGVPFEVVYKSGSFMTKQKDINSDEEYRYNNLWDILFEYELEIVGSVYDKPVNK